MRLSVAWEEDYSTYTWLMPRDIVVVGHCIRAWKVQKDQVLTEGRPFHGTVYTMQDFAGQERVACIVPEIEGRAPTWTSESTVRSRMDYSSSTIVVHGFVKGVYI